MRELSCSFFFFFFYYPLHVKSSGLTATRTHAASELIQRPRSFFLKIINSFRVHYLRLRINLIITELICLVMTARGVEGRLID